MQEELANSKTVVDNTLTESATLADASASGGTALPSGTLPLSAATTLRTTVLPRVAPHAPDTVEVSARPRYALAHRLGQGGVGDVLKAHDNDIDRPVAIKRIRSDAKSHAAVMRFAEEVRTIGSLEHPNIVPVHDVGLDQHGEYYFVMKYVHGETLESIIEKLAAGDADYHARYGFERRVELMMGVLEALSFAHANGIIHRDIKPANIMVGHHGEVMVMDWGLARKISGEELVRDASAPPLASDAGRPSRGRLFTTQVGTLLGTPAYMSPEQARGDALTEKSDIYSLCMTFYELLALVHPLEQKTSLEAMLAGVMTEPVPMAWVHSRPGQPMVPPDLAWYFAGGLSKDPAKRYASVDAMLARLRARAEGIIPVQCKLTLMMRVFAAGKRAMTRRPFATVGVVLLVSVWLLATTAYTVVHALR